VTAAARNDIFSAQGRRTSRRRAAVVAVAAGLVIALIASAVFSMAGRSRAVARAARSS